MSSVLALVEGETELAFVKNVLSPALAGRGVIMKAIKIGSARGHSGVRTYASNRQDILNALKDRKVQYCTTMVDYYGMPTDWPGRADAITKAFPHRASTVEGALHSDICADMGDSFNPVRFIPYLQMHEFEALLFSDPRVLAEALQSPKLETTFADIVKQCGSPEKIDDNPNTAPSKRIKELAHRYEKGAQAALITQRIGLATLRQKCPHFNEWICRLEELGQPRTP